MSVRRVKRRDPETGAVREYWMVDVDYQHPGGRRTRIRKVSPVQTRRGAEQYERDLRQAIVDGTFGKEKEVPTFSEWFEGRFWEEWVISRGNKPSEVESKQSIFRKHLDPAFGASRLDLISDAEVARFRAALVATRRSQKTINNILAVLSTPLRYAEKVRVIDRAPRVGLFKVERPEIECWELEQYARILRAAAARNPMWYAAVCLAGEAGLRAGEVKALRWREDVDLVARTITVHQQTRHGITGTPKGRTRRTVPITDTLFSALKSLDVVRTGLVIRNLDGTAVTDNQPRYALDEIYDAAELPRRGWHVLRHTFGTHAALFGVNPWRLQNWLGHKRIDETMLYVHHAQAHGRPLPTELLAAAKNESDPDCRIIKMLGARGNLTAPQNSENEKEPDPIVKQSDPNGI